MKNDDFNELMKQFKNLSLDEKKLELINKDKELINMICTIGKIYNKNISPLYNKEIDDLNYPYTEDDYIEILYAYTNILENTIVQLLDES